MDRMVDENGTPTTDPLAPSPDPPTIVTSVGNGPNGSGPGHQPHLVTATNIVHLTLPTHATAQVQKLLKVQSVIQPNQQSVIQTATNLQPVLSKANVILLSKPNSVIQTPQGNLQALQVVGGTESDDSYSEDDSPKRRRDLLTRRPSYRKILNDLGGGEIADKSAVSSSHANTAGNSSRTTTMVFTETKIEQSSSEGESELSSHSIPYHTVIPAGAIQITSGEGGQGIHTLTMTNSGASGAIVQYAQGQEFFVPVVQGGLGHSGGSLGGGSGSGGGGEDQTRKRELRLLKNREAARECRRKKKEYIKCLENRVAVLENQNKALIDELKTLKELYCKQQVE